MVMACCICAKECLPFNPQRSFHRIPTNEQMRCTWFSIIGRTISYKWARVCSDHFTENDFHEMNSHSKVRRLKKTAVPTVGVRNRKDKMEELSLFQENNINVSEIEFQTEKDIIYCSAENFEEDNTNNDVESKERKDKVEESSLFQENNISVSEIESQNDSEIEFQTEKDIIYCSTENFEEDNTNSDIECKESKNMEKSSPILNITENIVNVSLDSEREINTIFINNQKDVDNNFVKNSISGKRKLRKLENSKLRKIFVRMSKYNIECFRRVDFFSDKKWLAFTRYVAYNRHQTKILTQQNRRMEKKIDVLQDMMKDLMKS